MNVGRTLHLCLNFLNVEWGSRFQNTQGGTQWARVAKNYMF